MWPAAERAGDAIQQLNAPATPTAEGDAWPASARCNGASGSVCAPDSGLLAPPQRASDNCRRDCSGRVQMYLEADLGRDAGALDQLAAASDCERCTLLDGCNGLRTRSLKPRRVAVSNRPTITPLSRARLLHQVQTRRIRHHPTRPFRLPFNRLARSELRRILCSDEGALMRILQDRVARLR